MINKHLKDDLIILRRLAINESDLLITAFGKSLGKITMKAMGSKKILSKFIGKLEPLTVIRGEIYNSGRSFTLTNLSILISPPLVSSMKNFEIACEICKILYQTLPTEQPNQKIFEILETIIKQFPKVTKSDELLFYFYTQYLNSTGHMPRLNKCGICAEKHISEAKINEDGQIICQNCAKNPMIEISINTLKTLHFYTKTNETKTALKLKISEATKNELINFFNRYDILDSR